MTPKSPDPPFEPSPVPARGRPRSSLELYPADMPITLPIPFTACTDPSLQTLDGGYPWRPSPYRMPPRSVSMPESVDPGSTGSTNTMFNDSETPYSITTAPSSVTSGQSPRPLSLLLPDPDLDVPAPEYYDYTSQYADCVDRPAALAYQRGTTEEDADVEEVVRQPAIDPDHEAWVMQLPSPSPSGSSSSASEQSLVASDGAPALHRQLQLGMGSPDVLMLGFDRQTCGILSVKDGPNENPWRTMVWPLARESPALYHAIASMAAFHMSKHQPQLRVQGIEHMRSSLHELAAGLASMRVDAAIATTLALAFAESWDQHVSTGVDHIKGAKVLVNQALARYRRAPASYSADELRRLRFLHNTWLYMDVIARLTSADADDSVDFDAVGDALSPAGPFAGAADAALDPLMGCAATLFPLVGRVADLVRRVRGRGGTNAPAVISQAVGLKAALEAWAPPAFFDPPEDPTSAVSDSLQTAEAYRWATLLHLRRAVPEIPAPPPDELAKKALACLATVPVTSRAVVAHVYPLTAAGCEALDPEDRDWVRDRWHWMAVRLKVGGVDRARDVVEEVWRRKDEYEAGRPERALRGRPGSRQSSPALECADRELSVRGSVHWLGVMRDWKWEVLLG